MKDSPFLENELKELRNLKVLVEKALAQVSDEDFFRQIDPESNSIATIVKHLGGNMRSRWTDFLTTDGEKPDRDRDGEFVIEGEDTRASLEARWEEGWKLTFSALEALSDADLAREVRIRGEPHTVLRAISRHHGHLSYHAGQVVFLARHLAAGRWQALSIPRNPRRVPKGKMPQPR